jgi:hypothetical protein
MCARACVRVFDRQSVVHVCQYWDGCTATTASVARTLALLSDVLEDAETATAAAFAANAGGSVPSDTAIAATAARDDNPSALLRARLASHASTLHVEMLCSSLRAQFYAERNSSSSDTLLAEVPHAEFAGAMFALLLDAPRVCGGVYACVSTAAACADKFARARRE